MQQELAAARNEVAKLHTERDGYEENMKKAFMGGVCALNMEAMSMFRDGEGDEEKKGRSLESSNSQCFHKQDEATNSGLLDPISSQGLFYLYPSE